MAGVRRGEFFEDLAAEGPNALKALGTHEKLDSCSESLHGDTFQLSDYTKVGLIERVAYSHFAIMRH